ncbi:hypothetical protein RGU70_12800 [Herbaspirillum sp. RTI4]|uniref:hypothetical protein n=1 Tax=Herbaspirillum sp. RTI4 TaxID=3048640 RepID=UPI002AB38F5F|nr:hypothetical protein [Herbaspirillum sp. RTI4]MDY7579199.1 hypothetical protein [Herbaspirillum sp. RTI4]
MGDAYSGLMASIFFYFLIFTYSSYLYVELIIAFCNFDNLKNNKKKIDINFFKKPVIRILLAGLIFILLNYIHDAYIRSIATACSLEKSTQDGGIYTAEICKSPHWVMRLRIYDSQSKKLLAERNFQTSGSIDISWVGKKMWFYGEAGEEYINLPPTLSDRILAQLP